jgi:predicted enzyme related to lactoylglutathione lyase
VPGGGELGFHLAADDDLDAAVARARAFGATVVHEPRPEPWGRTARLHAPDGQLVGLTERGR